MMNYTGKRGTDKPIEIFVALFVILAVAMIVLQMFSSQISAKTEALKGMAYAADLTKKISNAKEACQDKCANALDNGCADAMTAQFCMAHAELDLNANGKLDDLNNEYLAGIGICEDKIYCTQIITCVCKRELNMKNCLNILCSYWKGQGLSAADQELAMATAITPGGCNYASNPQHWANIEKTRCS
ncbi:MAG: hypothetical protein ABIF10_00670 [Candidatus Woesearchaeota archaeon]